MATKKVDLIVQSAYHYLETHPSMMEIDDQIVDLAAIQSAAHVVTSFQSPYRQDPILLNTTDLLNLNSFHDHISWNISRFWQWQDLDIHDPYHVLSDANCRVSKVFYLTLGEWPDFVKRLPAFRIEDSYFNEIGMLSEAARLPPFVMVEGRFGARTGISADRLTESALKLPAVDLDATCLSGAILWTGAAWLPAIIEAVDWDMRFGSNLKKMLPAIRIDASFVGEFFLSVDVRLPGIVCEAAITVPASMWLNAKLPAFRIDTDHTISRLYSLDATLPTFRLAAFSYGGAGAILDELLPAFRMITGDSEVIADDLLTLDAILPTIIMRGIGAGIGADGQPGVIRDETRFDDYVLRYSRFA